MGKIYAKICKKYFLDKKIFILALQIRLRKLLPVSFLWTALYVLVVCSMLVLLVLEHCSKSSRMASCTATRAQKMSL